MLADKDGLYFLTAKGKKSVTLRGEVREIGQGLLSEIFEKNPYMKAIYPNAASRTALTVFQIYKGSGEFFDLSQKPIFRERFSFGGMESHMQYFFVTDECNGCECCVKICPLQAIERGIL